jgi:hypothetical protein
VWSSVGEVELTSSEVVRPGQVWEVETIWRVGIGSGGGGAK